MITTILFTSLLALRTISAPTPSSAAPQRGPIQITFWTASDCTENSGAGSNGHFTATMIYGTPIYKPIRSYNLSRDLYADEQLDFSTAGPDTGAFLDMAVINSPAACAQYDYSAYGSGRQTGCYTIESPFLYEACARLIINPRPLGVDSGLTRGQSTNHDTIATGLPPGATTEPSSDSGGLLAGQIHG